MDDSQNPSNEPPPATEPVRSRWTPKPEQILILESIFNSGMVNPPKDETVRIRKLLENFGSVGDANVFYWFQNRRSRSRRRQRQIQASLASGSAVTAGGQTAVYDPTAVASCSSDCTSPSSSTYSGGGGGPGFGYSSSSSGFVGAYKADDLFSVSTQMRGFGEESYGAEQYMSSYEAAQMPYQSGSISVFINGVHTEVPRGPIDIRAMFGEDVILVHSSGEPLAINEHGILLQSLQMGESYYLVASSS